MDYSKEIDKYLKKLFPICRSITGQGNRETLKILSEIVPLQIGEYPAGKPVYDWTIPPEWNIKDAWIKNADDEKIVDFKKSNLHVMSYSVPISQKLKGKDLIPHLHYLENLPEAIPYRTSYYKRDWGFCLSFNDFKKNINADKEYEVCIDSELNEHGSLTYGELLIKGGSKKEYLISTYICHPSLANDNLSGPVLTAFLAKELLKKKLRYSYRIIFIPETIGAIAYCAHNEGIIKKIEAGLVVTTVGGPGKMGYKQSWNKQHYLNRICEKILTENNSNYKIYLFDCHGSDERQYSSPGFRMNVVSITKDKYYDYPQYHTSMDDLTFISSENINQTLNVYLNLIDKIESRVVYRCIEPHGEVMLSRHGLYPHNGGAQIPGKTSMTELDLILKILFLIDGNNSIDEIANELDVDQEVAVKAIDKLEKCLVIEKI